VKNGSFHVTEGWVENFKKRASLHLKKRIGESASADHVGGADYNELVKKTIEADHLPEIYSRDGGVMAPYTDVYKDVQEMAGQCNKSFCFAKSSAFSPPHIPFHHGDKFQPETPTCFQKKRRESFNLVVFIMFRVVHLTEFLLQVFNFAHRNFTFRGGFFFEECDPRDRQGFNFLKPTGHVMHQQFNIQQLYALPTLY